MATKYIVLQTVVDGDNAGATTGEVFAFRAVVEAFGGEQAIRVAQAAQAATNGSLESWHAVPLTRWTSVDTSTEVPAPKTTFTPGRLPGGTERMASKPRRARPASSAGDPAADDTAPISSDALV